MRLKARKLSQRRICWKILASRSLRMPLMMHFSRILSEMPISSIMVSRRRAVRPVNSWKILVYSNLFSSASSKLMQFSSMKSRRGLRQMGEVRYCRT